MYARALRPKQPLMQRKLFSGMLDVAVMGVMTALLEVSKRLLDSIPNVELITLLMVVFTLAYGKRVILVSVAFTLIETAYWGIHYWVIMYLYIWPLLILFVDIFRKKATLYFCCITVTVYGLIFGALCSIPYYFIGGWNMMFAFWIAGIRLDLVHGAGNLVMCTVLFVPLMRAAEQIPLFRKRVRESGYGIERARRAENKAVRNSP